MSRKGKGKRAPRWSQTTLRMKENHTWKAPDGYAIIALDKGAVRFNIPSKWNVVPEPDSIKIFDGKPPDDNCCLAASYLRLPPGIDWSELPLTRLIEEALGEPEHDAVPHGEIITMPRDDIELVWREMSFIDPVEKREAFTRIAIARGFNLQALITFAIWPEDVERLEPIWQEVLRSVILGRYIADPTRGDVLQ